MVMVDVVREEYGAFSLSDEYWCIANVQVSFWAITRRRKLSALYTALSSKREGVRLSNGEDTSRTAEVKRAMTDADAFIEYYAKRGINFVQMPG